MERPEKRCQIIWNPPKRFKCATCSRSAYCKDIKYNQSCDDHEPYIKYLKDKIDSLPNEDKIAEIIKNFDGNSIIHTDYDSEPSITDDGIKQIAKAIHKRIRREI